MYLVVAKKQFHYGDEVDESFDFDHPVGTYQELDTAVFFAQAYTTHADRECIVLLEEDLPVVRKTMENLPPTYPLPGAEISTNPLDWN